MDAQQNDPWAAMSSPVAEGASPNSAWDTMSSPIVEASSTTQADGSPLGLRNVPTAKSDPIYHGAVPIGTLPDQGATTAFASGVQGAPIVGPAISSGIQAAAAGARSLAHGTSYGDERQNVQAMTDLARYQHPAAAFAGDLTGAATATAPLVMAAPEAFGAGPGGLTAGKVATGAMSGGAIGGADAAARTDADPTSIAAGTLGGIGGGAAGPVLGAGASRISQTVADVAGRVLSPDPGISRPAADILTRTIANDGQLGVQGLQNIGAAGSHGMLVDASPSLSGVLDAALQHGGPGAAAARQAIDARAAVSGQDMSGALDQAFGAPQGVYSATAGIRDNSAAARQAAYDAAYASPIDYTTDAGRSLEDMISNRVPPGIIARAQNQMRVDGVMPPQQSMASIASDGTVSYRQMPDVRMVDYITRSLNDVSRMGDGQGALGGNTAEGRAYGSLASDLRTALRQASPSYGTALDTAAQPIQARNALEFGSTMLHPSIPRDAVAGTLQGMTDPELAQVRQGVRSQIADTMANVQRTVTDSNVDARQATAMVKALSSAAAQDKMGLLLQPEEQQAVSGALDRAGRSLDLRASVSRNSATAARLNTNQTIGMSTEPGMVKQALAAGGPMKSTRPVMQYLLGTRPQDIAAKQDALYGELASTLTRPQGQAAGGILDRLIQGNDTRAGISSIAGAVPYGALSQTGILSLLPQLQARAQ